MNEKPALFDAKHPVNVHKPAIVTFVKPDVNCPACGNPCRWRRGVHFDHERICHDCDLSWTPGDDYLLFRPVDGVVEAFGKLVAGMNCPA